MRLFGVQVLVVVALAGCAPNPPHASLTACVASAGRDASEIPGGVGFAAGGYRAFGDGPAYPAFITPESTARLSYGPLPKENGRALVKVIWIVDPSYSGTVVAAGASTDNTNIVRFQSPSVRTETTNELQFNVRGGGTMPAGYIYFDAPGCYRLTFRGATFDGSVTVRVDP
jgi:hypothetical protein